MTDSRAEVSVKHPVPKTVILLIAALAASTSAQVPPEEDPVNLSPQYYTVLFENDEVRVIEYRLPPGEKEPMHSHPEGVVRDLSDAAFKAIAPDGTESEGSVNEGDVQWREFTRHAVENVGTTEAVAFAVELKKPAKKDNNTN